MPNIEEEKARVIGAFETALGSGALKTWLVPWAGWLYLAVLRQRLARERAQPFLAPIREREKCSEPVPELAGTGWFRVRHGDCVGLKNQLTGELIDIPLDLAADEIEPFGVAWRIAGVALGEAHTTMGAPARFAVMRKFPEQFTDDRFPPALFPEARLWRWTPSMELIQEAIEMHGEVGNLDMRGRRVVVPVWLESYVEPIARLDFADPVVQRRWATAFGDVEIVGDVGGWTTRRMWDEHSLWVQRLVRTEWPRRKRSVLPILFGALPTAEVVWAIETIMNADDQAMVEALDLLNLRDDLPPSHHLVRRAEEIEANTATIAVARMIFTYVVGRGLETPAVVGRLAALADRAVREADAEAVPLVLALLECDLASALPLVRTCLRSDATYLVIEIAAALVAIERAWAVQELVSATEHGPPQYDLIAHAVRIAERRDRPDGPFAAPIERYRRRRWRRLPDRIDGEPR